MTQNIVGLQKPDNKITNRYLYVTICNVKRIKKCKILL